MMYNILDTRIEVPSSRPFYRYKYTSKRENLNQPLNLIDKDAGECFFNLAPPKSLKNKDNFVKVETAEMGFQIIPNKFDKGVSTEYKIKKNKIINTEQNNPLAVLDKEAEDKLLNFLNDKFYFIEEALVENETLNVYINDLAIGEDIKDPENSDTGLSIIKEKKSFEYENCKQKLVSDIKFISSKKLMAVSFIEDLTYEERIDINGKSYESSIIIWDYEDLHRFTPIAILECPVEVVCFEFKPDDSRYLIAAGINGQVFLYDLIKLTKIDINTPLNSKRTTLTKFNKDIEFIKPVLSSAIVESFNANQNLIVAEMFSRKLVHVSSHKSPIKGLSFLPVGIEVDRKNPTKFIHYEGDIHPDRNQFITLSHDGQFLIWELNFSDPKEKKHLRLDETDFTKVTWKALNCIQVFKNDTKILYANNMVLCPQSHSSKLYFTNEDGGLSELDYDIERNFNKDINKLEIIKKTWQPFDESNPINMDISYFIKGLVLVVNETNFCLYSEEYKHPVFVSSFSTSAKFTCGRFSIKRPSVLYIGRNDGALDIWDFCDQSSQPSQQHLVSAVGIGFIQLNPHNHDLIAVGDDDSCIKLLSLPQNLYKKLNNEESIMLEFIQKEACRDRYYETKFHKIEEKIEREQTMEQERDRKNIDSDDDLEASVYETIEYDRIDDEYSTYLEDKLKTFEDNEI